MGKDRRVGDQVLTHIFVGHVLDHDRDSYCMYYSKTERISKIHDIIWLKWMNYPRIAEGSKVQTLLDCYLAILQVRSMGVRQ